MSNDLVQILDGNTFVVSDRRGDIEASLTDPTGLFSFDTRFLSKWVLTVNGERLNALSTDDLHYWEARFFLVPGHGHRLRRRQVVGDPPARGRRRVPRGDHDPESRRSARRPRDPRRSRQRFRRPVRGQGRPEEAGRRTRVASTTADSSCATRATRTRRRPGSPTTAPATIDEHGLTFDVADRARTAGGPPTSTSSRSCSRSLASRPDAADERGRARRPRSRHGAAPRLLARRRRRASSPTRTLLKATYRRSLVDLAALRFSPLTMAGHSLPAAGLPWFMTMFGRDSILTSLQALPFAPELARDHAACARRAPGNPRRRFPRRGSRAGSCTRCASER